jgi:radical SAM superfamily enzyme YgiQ (UPF0313 family)
VATLKDPGAILLVSCYELGHQPLSLASPAAVLRGAGYSPALLDLAVNRIDETAARRARLIALSVPMHTALRLGVVAAARLRDLNPDAHLCFYGLYASLNAAALFASGADSIIGGEVEEPLLRLAQDLGRAGAARETGAPVPGVRTRRHPAGPWIAKAPFAVPDRTLLPPLDGYVRLEADGAEMVAGHVEASRGCLHLCRHCPIPPVYRGRFFVVPRHIVLADIRAQVAVGARHITFGDPDFLNGPGHTIAIARAMHAEFPGLTFDCTAKVEHLLRHRDRLPDLRDLGCLFIVTAAESLSDRVLAILDKGHTRADIDRVIVAARDAGIALRPTWVPFTPWTGLADYRDLLRFVVERDLVDATDPVQLSIRLLVPPGSLLEDHPDFVPCRGELDANRFTWTWIHPDPRMDLLQQEVTRIVSRSARPGGHAPGERPVDAGDAGHAAGTPHDGAGPAASPAGAWETFSAIVAAADRASGRDVGVTGGRRAAAAPPRRDKGRAPRLTEPWFC